MTRFWPTTSHEQLRIKIIHPCIIERPIVQDTTRTTLNQTTGIIQAGSTMIIQTDTTDTRTARDRRDKEMAPEIMLPDRGMENHVIMLNATGSFFVLFWCRKCFHLIRYYNFMLVLTYLLKVWQVSN